MNGNHTHWRPALFVALAAVGVIGLSSGAYAAPNSPKVCSPDKVGTPEMFRCESYTSKPKIAVSALPATAQSFARGTPASRAPIPGGEFFPQNWSQLGFNQRHNPVFSVPAGAPAYLKQGTFWAAPLTGLDFMDLRRALPASGNPEAWGSTTSQHLGNVMGASVARGIVYVQNGRREIWAIRADTGAAIWRNEVTASAGMGQAVVEEVNGRLMVFSPVGDAAFTVQNAIDFTHGKPHFRGANFAGVYAYDGLTGKQLWRYDTQGSARPTPVYRDGKLYVNTNNNTFIVLDAATGNELGSAINPGNGFAGLAAANWYDTADGRRLIVYGTIRPRRILAMDVTNPAAPSLAWTITPANATANAPGDTSAAVDPELGLVFTTVFVNTGTDAAPVFDLNMLALNATTGAVVWSQLMGEGDSPPGYKGSVPMVHNGVVYAGNTSNGTFQAFNASTGARLWVADFREADDPAEFIHRPRAAAVFYEGKVIVAEGRDIHTLDAATGVELNRFENPGLFGVWGINQPVIIGKLLIQSSISGWVFAAPVDFITSQPGVDPSRLPIESLPFPQIPPEYMNPKELPGVEQAKKFPSEWLSYTAGQDHNSYVRKGPENIAWQTPLKDAYPLGAPPLDEALYGSEVASHMMHQYVGVGSGVSPVNGILYTGSDRYSINALNATTGKIIWRTRTQNANFGQPIVTPNTVVAGGGDPWLNLGGTGGFRSQSPNTTIGDNWGYMRGFHPTTGVEKWTVYSGLGTSSMTPLYNKGNLYWVNGEGKVWAANADSGEPVAPFMDADGLPVLSLGGFNAVSSANIYRQGNADIMVVGMSMPNRMVAIDLTTAAVLWTQDLAVAGTTYLTGFATVSPAVSQKKGLVVGTVLVNADVASNTITQLAFALNATTGQVVWTQAIATGPIPVGGFVGPTPLLDKDTAYMNNPIGNDVVALDLLTGAIQWRAAVSTLPGRFSWAPGVLVNGKLIQPVGPTLYTLDTKTGQELNRYTLGGSMTFNHPTVIGKTLYVGNSWGWVTAVPVELVTGDKFKNDDRDADDEDKDDKDEK